MITTRNFEDLLKSLEFEKEGNTYQKSIGEATLKVDVDNSKIIYPEGLEVKEGHTCNFLQNENFVVFECVYQLLKKGYKPEHLELEPKWKVGHGASGGRADILVKDQEKNPLLLIECKTAGEEFKRAWRKTLQNGDQLFSYAQQIPQTQYLCLYASDFVDDKIRTDQRIIAHRDNEKILAQNDELRPFAKATDIEDRYAIWCDTYEREYTETGIFEENIQPYNIGKNKYTLEDDTKEIDATDAKNNGKSYEFQTILRQHNIARREQAFEVLVNLFLCKLVDEEDNKTDLKFSWKGIAYDNYFDYVDRLQNLYRTGMEKYLGKNISYISNEEIDNAFWAVRNDRNATKKKIQDYFRKLKFFTNSAFSLIDTHNEDLFKRNAKVLLEIVQMWERIRLKTNKQNQFLGDMFELFLDDGIKQSRGQYFTPLPICKFIVGSLPLAKKLVANPEPLKVIDYACGSGHFLNEYAYQIKQLDENDEIDREIDLNDYYANITGIEKEDRLAKVAKVAAYMHGQDQIKILDIDALADRPEITKESFDVLVANPPFSVDRFIDTLSKDDKKHYRLTQYTSEKNGNIECFFIERIFHLISHDGVVGVIVPYGILHNKDELHIRTREILLQYFDFISIVHLGTGTFGETPTNTVVLFLKRKLSQPEVSDQYFNRVEDYFEGDKDSDIYRDDYLIQAYCNHIEVPHEEYIKLFNQTSLKPIADLLEYDIFQDYQRDFKPDKEIEKIKKSKEFKDKSEEEQSLELGRRLITYIHNIEKDKLYYFILAYTQESRVLIVKAPSTTKEKRKFLGYKWSSAEDRQRIVYIGGDTVNDIITPLFDPKDLDNQTKINTAIKRNYIGQITDPLPEHCQYANLTDMLNFARTKFNKAISLNPKQNINVDTKWPPVKLGNIVDSINGLWEGENEPFSTVNVIRNTNFAGDGKIDLSDVAVLDVEAKQYQDRKLQIGDIIVEKSGGSNTQAVGRVVYFDIKEGEYSFSNFTSRLRIKDKNIKPKYLMIFLNYFYEQGYTFYMQYGISGIRNLDFDRYLEIDIPLAPLEEQKNIIDEYEAVDQKTDQAQQIITASKQQIEEKVNQLWNESEKVRLDNVIWINTTTYNPTQKPDDEFIYIDIASVGKANGVINYSKRIIGKDAPSRARRIAKNGNTIISTVRPYLKGFAFVDTNNIDDCVFSTGFAILESKNTESLLDKIIYYFFMYMDELMLQMKNRMEKSAYPSIDEDDIKYFQFPFPSLDIQQQLVAEVEQLEAKITEVQAVLDNATDRKNTILTTHL